MLPKGHLWTLLSSLVFFASERKHGKAHRLTSLVNGTCCFKKGEFGELVADAQAWWPYIVTHVDQTSIFALYITRLKFRNNHQKICVMLRFGPCARNIDTFLG